MSKGDKILGMSILSVLIVFAVAIVMWVTYWQADARGHMANATKNPTEENIAKVDLPTGSWVFETPKFSKEYREFRKYVAKVRNGRQVELIRTARWLVDVADYTNTGEDFNIAKLAVKGLDEGKSKSELVKQLDEISIAQRVVERLKTEGLTK